MKFLDRRDAGRILAETLAQRRLKDPLVLALPRGGVPVAFEVAKVLHAPMDVFVSRKMGAPGYPEFGIGAIAEGGVRVFDERTISTLGLTPKQLDTIAAAERVEVDRRVEEYRGGRQLPAVFERDVVLVDDGLATGVTAEAALNAIKVRDPRLLILAAPVCATPTRERLKSIADEVICAEASDTFFAVGLWYEDFSQTSDHEVRDLLAAASQFAPGSPSDSSPKRVSHSSR